MKEHRALVVDDDDAIREVVGDILDSLGHKYDMARTQDEARALLRKGAYSYALLDLEIPVKAGGLPRIQNGINLLHEVRRAEGMATRPVLVMTGHGKNSPELAVQVMKCGAVDYVTKPFPSVGETLDKCIIDALRKADGPSKGQALPVQREGKGKLEPFSQARRELVINRESIELCGITVWSDRSTPDMRIIAEELACKHHGRYVRLGGKALAAKLDRDCTNPVGRTIKGFCDNAGRLMAEQCGLSCGRYDVISSTTGYHFTDWIDVTMVDAEGRRTSAPDDQTAGAGGDVAAKLTGLPVEKAERLQAICEALEKRDAMSIPEIRELSGVSRPQTTRDLKILVDRGLVEKTGSRQDRVYRRVSK